MFSSVIDLLFNVASFVYVGAWMPFDSFNNGTLTLSVGRLVLIALLVLMFKRLPIMIALYKFIPDVKTLREAFFSGHFGPVGIGELSTVRLSASRLNHLVCHVQEPCTSPLSQLGTSPSPPTLPPTKQSSSQPRCSPSSPSSCSVASRFMGYPSRSSPSDVVFIPSHHERGPVMHLVLTGLPTHNTLRVPRTSLSIGIVT